jgi:hypothetical protein
LLCVLVKGENMISREGMKSKLSLVDLVGNKRMAKSNANDNHLKESWNINTLLLALRDVI